MFAPATALAVAAGEVVGSVSVTPDAIQLGMAVVALGLVITAGQILWESRQGDGLRQRPRVRGRRRMRSARWADACGGLR